MKQIKEHTKILMVGHIANGFGAYDGQTVKTRELHDALVEYYGENAILTVDTHGWKKHPLKLLKEFFRSAKRCPSIIMLVDRNGLQVFSALLVICKWLWRNKIYYDVIGGWLAEETEKNKRLQFFLKKFDSIWVETTVMKKDLKTQGFKNITIVYNFKNLQPLSETEIKQIHTIPLRACTFSRVMPEKGIEDAIDAVKILNHKEFQVELDIFGAVDKNCTNWFEQIQRGFPEYIRYMGCIEPDKSIDILRQYDVLLFPTHYATEGIPGTIIDAYFAGVPVIAARWNSFEDVICDGITGIGYAMDNKTGLVEALKTILANPRTLNRMQKNCLDASKKYSRAEFINSTGGGEYSQRRFGKVRCCTFSRVMKEKGIEDAVNAVLTANDKLGMSVFYLDIYGKVEADYENLFENIKRKFPVEICYKGCTAPTDSVKTLCNYDLLLFPTFYESEGLPGTIIDAYAAGLPVIATDWKYNSEFVRDGVTGFLVQPHDVAALTEKLIYVYEHQGEINNMRFNCINEYKKYDKETVIKKIVELIDG